MDDSLTTRRNILKGGAGLAAILASGKAPAYLIKSMLAARNSIGMKSGGAKLPYDAEVEYLKSTGTQWIDTGIVGNGGITSSVILSAQGYTNNSCVLGSYGSGGERCWLCYMFGNVWYLGYCSGAQSSSGVSLDTIYTVDTSISNSSVTLSVDGVAIKTFAYPVFNTNLSLYMFAMNLSSGANYKAKAKVYSCKIYDNGVLVRDFIPVRIGTEGAMYDRVSGQLFRNAGTGAFGYGNDK